MHTFVVILLTSCFVFCLINFGFKEEDEKIDRIVNEKYPPKNDENSREKRSRKQTQQIKVPGTGVGEEPSIKRRLNELTLFPEREQTARQKVLLPRKRRDLSFKNLTTTATSPTLFYTPSKEFLLNATNQGPFVPSTTSKPFLPNCSSSFSCRGRCQKNQTWFESNEHEKYSCYCDDQCEMFKDCCADFDLFCPLLNNSLSSSAYFPWKCHSDIWMIDQCPGNWSNNQVLIKCITKQPPITRNNSADVIPVVSRSGKTYRNRFCALCHGENSDSIEHYGLDFNCVLSPPQGYSTQKAIEFLFEYCPKIKWRPKEGQIKRRCVKMFEQCHGLGDVETSTKCIQNPTRMLVTIFIRETYKNIYCAKCLLRNEDKLKSLDCGPTEFPTSLHLTPLTPFHIITDIGNNEMATRFKANNQKFEVYCFYNNVYDKFLELCRPLSQKSSIPITSHLDRYRIALWITFGVTFASRIRNYDPRMVSDTLAFSLGLNAKDIQLTERAILKELDVLILEMRIDKRLVRRRTRSSFEQLSIESLLNFTRPLRFVFQNDSFIIIKATSRLLTCVHVQYFTTEDYVVLHGLSSIYINQTEEMLTEKQYFANYTKIHNGYRIPVGWIAVCRQHVPSTLTCNGTYISLYKDEYVMLPNNSVYRNVSSTIYNQGEYININGSVVVCTNYSNRYIKTQPTDESQDDKALRILTYIGLSLSVICLVFVLVTYLLFGELRTLPGINLMNLSSALLVAHFVWLIGSGQTGSHGACVAIAVILHFSFIASFVWMSIIAFSTWKIFSSVQKEGTSSDNESRKKKIRYTLAIGWLPALVLVLICLSLDQSEAIKIEYGGAKGCWINNGRANLFIFVLPITASVVWNVVFFGLTVKALRKVTQQTRMVKEQRNYNAVYVKIAVLMGFTWIFGLLASFVSFYFTYPFVALNTIQGVYIAVCFTFTRRVRLLFAALISGSNVKPRIRSGSQPQGDQARKTQTQTTRL